MSIAPQLRLFSVDDEPLSTKDQQRQMTLLEAYKSTICLGSRAKKRARGTLKDYWTALSHWSRLMESDGPLGIGEINDEMLDDFGDLLQLEEKSNRTINKVCGHVEAILKTCGPRTGRNRRGLEILERFVFAEKREEETMIRRRLVPKNDMSRIYEACRIASWPDHPTLPAPLVWRTALVLFWNVGLRRNDCRQMKLSSVHWEVPCPIPELRSIENEHGWLEFLPAKTMRRKPQPVVIPLNETMRHHLKWMTGKRQRLLTFPDWNRDFYRWLYKFRRKRESKSVTRLRSSARPATSNTTKSNGASVVLCWGMRLAM